MVTKGWPKLYKIIKFDGQNDLFQSVNLIQLFLFESVHKWFNQLTRFNLLRSYFGNNHVFISKFTLTRGCDVNECQTKLGLLLNRATQNVSLGKSSFSGGCQLLWRLSLLFEDAQTLKAFKTRFKSFLFSQTFQNGDDTRALSWEPLMHWEHCEWKFEWFGLVVVCLCVENCGWMSQYKKNLMIAMAVCEFVLQWNV